MRLAEVKIEGAKRNLILRYSEGSDAVDVIVCDHAWTEQPVAPVTIDDDDDAWHAAENAHWICEGYEGTHGDVSAYYELFLRARRS